MAPIDRFNVSLDDDTMFFFNYRSDRMREIVAVFGLPDKPMDVDVPNNLVSEILTALAFDSKFPTGYLHDVQV